MKDFFRAVKNIFFGIFSFLILAICCMLFSLPLNQGGLGMNGFLAFLIWVGLMFVFVKVSTVGSAVIAVIILLGGRIAKLGISTDFLENAGDLIGTLIGGALVFIIIIRMISSFFGDGGDELSTKSSSSKPLWKTNSEKANVKAKSEFRTLEVTYKGETRVVEIIYLGYAQTGDIIRGHCDGYDRYDFSKVIVGDAYEEGGNTYINICFEGGEWQKYYYYEEVQRLIY